MLVLVLLQQQTQYVLDRWRVSFSQSSKIYCSAKFGSVTLPAGFTNYLGITSLAATSTSSDYYYLGQSIEGFNIADLGWGTANAKTVTLSFQVYSSLTGAFGGSLYNNGGARVISIYLFNSCLQILGQQLA